MDVLTGLLFVGGLVALVQGAELLVRGAARLAAAAGIPPLVIGLTVVSFGTSAPELAVNIGASWSGQPTLAVGNAVGSNVFNVLFILGVSALVVPLHVARQLVRLDVPLMIGVSVAAWLLAFDGLLSRFEGIALFAVAVVYTAWLVRSGAGTADDVPPPRGTTAWNVGLVLAGIALLLVGSRWLVQGAVALAHAIGVSETVIGLTIVAGGTSLPEVATSVLASLRGQRDIAVGNVVGSNVFNVLVVLGLGAAVAPAGLEVPEAVVGFDMPVMLAAALACLPIFFTAHRIDRWEGALFLGYYLAYTAYLILEATEHDALPVYSDVMLWFVLPLTALTLMVLGYRALRAGRG